MSAQLEGGADGRWRLSGALDFDSVPGLFAQTDTLLAGAAAELDLSGVEQANSAGVALLLEWRRQAHRRGVALALHGLPTSIRRIAGLAEAEKLLTGEHAPVGDAIP